MIYEKERRYIIPFEDVPSPRAVMPEISVDERRGNFVEVETGFPESMATQEAKRCLSCRRCLGCALCWAECKPEAIYFDAPDEELNFQFDDVVLTKGQDNAFQRPDARLGYGRYPEVITDLQFERMLAPNGPTDGLVFSPLNGEVPARLAIVQAHPKEGEAHLLPSLVLGVNEAILALDRNQELEVSVISPLCDAFKDRFLADAQNITGLTLIEAIPESIERKAEQAPLTLSYIQNNAPQEAPFDLIVLLTKPKTSPDITALSKKLDKPIL